MSYDGACFHIYSCLEKMMQILNCDSVYKTNLYIQMYLYQWLEGHKQSNLAELVHFQEGFAL